MINYAADGCVSEKFLAKAQRMQSFCFFFFANLILAGVSPEQDKDT